MSRCALSMSLSLLLAAQASFAQTATPPQGAAPTAASGLATAAAAATTDTTGGAPNLPALPLSPLDAVAAASGPVTPYGAQLFQGHFSAEQFSGFSEDYRISVGDRIQLKVWGAVSVEQALTVDAQGAVFIPQVGPVSVQGVRNADLNKVISAKTATVFRNNVEVYAVLDAAQPVKIFVSGAVPRPGLYAGVSADSVLRFLDKAGGIDPTKGSYVGVRLMRGGKQLAKFNLYDFLRTGDLPSQQLADGDVLVVGPRADFVTVTGVTAYQAQYELTGLNSQTVADVLSLASPQPGATHFELTRLTGTDKHAQMYPLAQAKEVTLQAGDTVDVSAEQRTANVSIKVTGAHAGAQTVTLPTGATLADVLKTLTPDARTQLGVVQVYRKSVALEQKVALNKSLDQLQQTVLTARSATKEESDLRKEEAALALQFISRARQVEPQGQVVLPRGSDPAEMMLEDGDVINIPSKSSLVLVNGEVRFPSGVAWSKGKPIAYYLEKTGGMLSLGDDVLVVVHVDGSAQPVSASDQLEPGDEIFVLPKVETKYVELARGITEVLFRIAFAAKVVVGL